jgi:L-ribulose-5-phosphate 4-epimerase
MLEELKKKVYEANLLLVKYGLVIFTWGNVSSYDQKSKLIVIKPSGVPYESMKEDDMVVVDLNGNVVEGRLNPSSDTPTHIEIYKKHPELGGIVHTHSTYATSFAQGKKEIVCYGTTQADTFYGSVPLCRELKKEEIEKDYEKNTGIAIVQSYKDEAPGILVPSHGVFAWGSTPSEAVEHAKIIEEVAKMAFISESLNPNIKPINKDLLDKHYFRKHGPNSYYGQKKK